MKNFHILIALIAVFIANSFPSSGQTSTIQIYKSEKIRMIQQGNVFIGANLSTGVTTQAGLSATTPALTLYNPTGSGKKLVLLTVTVDVLFSPAAATGFFLAFNPTNATAPTSVTAGTLQNADIGNTTTGGGVIYRVATLAAAPTSIRALGGTVGGSSSGVAQLIDHVDGEVFLEPGGCLSIQANAAAVVHCTFTWLELPEGSGL